VERSLRQAGITLTQVLEAGNGAEALPVLQDKQVDLILCDINMLAVDGLKFVKQLARIENAKGVPVVMITTEGSESHVVQAVARRARIHPEAVHSGSGEGRSTWCQYWREKHELCKPGRLYR
jgi:two-component system, chemotaxis family, chemotaxis protein CheY